MSNVKDLDFGEHFPSIEIDTEYWKSLDSQEKIKYLFRLMFQEKDFGNRLKLINYVMGMTSKVGKVFIKNKEIREYFDLLEQSANLISLSATVGNIFKAKQKYRNTKNNEIAKLMGFPNGNYVDESKMEITQSMIECFVNMPDHQRLTNKIAFTNVLDSSKEGKNGEAPEETPVTKTFTITGTIGGDGAEDKGVTFGLVTKTIVGLIEDEDTTSTTTCKIFYPSSGMKIHPSELKEELIRVMIELYVEKVDTRKNIIGINGTKLDVIPRVVITEEITNIDVPRLHKAMKKILSEEKRRGSVLVGEPGVGKTITVHKVINQFPDRLCFWVSPDSINTVHGIRSTFKIFKMFKNSIVVFDDLDSAPLTNKDETTNEFLKHLDGKNNKDLTGFFLATVNDPSKLHMAVINRPERFDDVIHVKNPQNVDEISSIVLSKAREHGYYPKTEVKKHYGANGTIEFTTTSKQFKDLAKKVIEHQFTQVQVAGLIADCHTYCEDGKLTMKLLTEATESRLESIKAANMVARKGRLRVDTNEISEEAHANLGKRR